MGIAERRLRQQGEDEARILAAAEELIVRHGFKAVSMRKIAARIEYSTTKVYAHFKSKEDLLLTLLQFQYNEVGERFAAVLEKPWDSPLSRLKALVKTYIQYGLDHDRLWYDSIQPVIQDGVMCWTIKAERCPAFAPWWDAIAECLQGGFFGRRSAQEVFQLLWIQVQGFVTLRNAYPSYPWGRADRQIDDLLQVVTDGLALGPAIAGEIVHHDGRVERSPRG